MCEEDKINNRAIELAMKLKADPSSEFQRDFDGNTPLYTVCEPWIGEVEGKGDIPRTIALIDTLLTDSKAGSTETLAAKLAERNAKEGIDPHKAQFLTYLEKRLTSNGGEQQDISQEFEDTPMDYIFKNFKSKMEGTKERIIKRIEVLKPSLRLCAICNHLLASYSCSTCLNPLLCEICAEALNRTRAEVPGCKLKCPLCQNDGELRFEEMIWEPNIDGGA